MNTSQQLFEAGLLTGKSYVQAARNGLLVLPLDFATLPDSRIVIEVSSGVKCTVREIISLAALKHVTPVLTRYEIIFRAP